MTRCKYLLYNIRMACLQVFTDSNLNEVSCDPAAVDGG